MKPAYNSPWNICEFMLYSLDIFKKNTAADDIIK